MVSMVLGHVVEVLFVALACLVGDICVMLGVSPTFKIPCLLPHFLFKNVAKKQNTNFQGS